MAVTWLNTLHPCRSGTRRYALKKEINYIEDPAKTRNGELVTGYECDPMSAPEEFLLCGRQHEVLTGAPQSPEDLIGITLIQSFKPGEITPEEANRVGYETAMRFTEGNFQFLVATHTDRPHIHNHILVNAYSLDGRGKARHQHRRCFALLHVSNEICREHNLSVISLRPRGEREAHPRFPAKLSHCQTLRADLDAALRLRPESFSELVQILVSSGYEYLDNPGPAVRLPDWKKPTEFSALGTGYTREDLEERMAGRQPPPSGTCSYQGHRRQPDHTLLLDLQKKITRDRSEKDVRAIPWAKLPPEQISEALLLLRTERIDSMERMDQVIKESRDRMDSLLQSQREEEAGLKEITELKTHMDVYRRSEPVYRAWRASGSRPDYYERHRDLLLPREMAVKAFHAFVQKYGGPLPSDQELRTRYADLLKRKKADYAAWKAGEARTENYHRTRSVIRTILREDAPVRNLPAREEPAR